MKFFQVIFSIFQRPHHPGELDSIKHTNAVWLKGVDRSVKKFSRTYKLLERYDKESVENPDTLAGAGRLRPYLRQIQKLG